MQKLVPVCAGREGVVKVRIEDLALMEEMEDCLDLEAADAVLAEEGENIKLADLKAELGL